MKTIKIIIIMVLGLMTLYYFFSKPSLENQRVIGPDEVFTDSYQTVIFAGGCFWCIESALQETEGVYEAVSGYVGGLAKNARYQNVITGRTNHREAVWVSYNPKIVSYEKLLEVFWERIDPTDAGGQFSDRGYQYTTAVYYYSEAQKEATIISRKAIDESDFFDESVVTEVLPATIFYIAEDYHQDFYLHSSERYDRYEFLSGRNSFIKEFWGGGVEDI